MTSLSRSGLGPQGHSSGHTYPNTPIVPRIAVALQWETAAVHGIRRRRAVAVWLNVYYSMISSFGSASMIRTDSTLTRTTRATRSTMYRGSSLYVLGSFTIPDSLFVVT